MPEEIILDEPYASVRANPAVPCIIVQLHAFANREQFKHLMSAGLAYYKSHSQPTRRWGWIADTRQMSAISKEVQQWLTDDWNPQACAAGLCEMSIVTSTNVLGRMATEQYAQQARAQTGKYELAPIYYPTLEDAKQGVIRRCTALNAS